MNTVMEQQEAKKKTNRRRTVNDKIRNNFNLFYVHVNKRTSCRSSYDLLMIYSCSEHYSVACRVMLKGQQWEQIPIYFNLCILSQNVRSLSTLCIVGYQINYGNLVLHLYQITLEILFYKLLCRTCQLWLLLCS